MAVPRDRTRDGWHEQGLPRPPTVSARENGAPAPRPRFAGMTHTGLEREINEDHFLVADLTKVMHVHETSVDVDPNDLLFRGTKGQLFIVADGVGGNVAGERASELAVQTMSNCVLNFVPWFLRLGRDDEEELTEELEHAIRRCEAVVDEEAASVPGRAGMGTTLTVAYVFWPYLYVVHVGDSRCYILRGSSLHQVTKDHTVAQSLIDEGTLDADQAARSQWIHVLWNAIGRGEEELRPEVTKVELEPGDALLLCSDGLTKHVSDGEIVSILSRQESEGDTCRRLIERANAAGGTDNTTVIVARFPSPSSRASSATELPQAP